MDFKSDNGRWALWVISTAVGSWTRPLTCVVIGHDARPCGSCPVAYFAMSVYPTVLIATSAGDAPRVEFAGAVVRVSVGVVTLTRAVREGPESWITRPWLSMIRIEQLRNSVQHLK